MRYLEVPKRFPTPDKIHNYEPVHWIAWVQEKTQLIEGINEEIRLLNEDDDPFSGKTSNTQTGILINRQTGEILPGEKLATPLVPEKVDNPLPQRLKQEEKHKTSEIPPDNTLNFTQGCGYEGHIKRYSNNYVYCDYCRTYSHHTLVCRSYPRQTQTQPVTSSRRNSPINKLQTPGDNGLKEKSNQTKDMSNKEESLLDITKKHLAQIISAMIPSTHSTLMVISLK